MSSIFGKIKAPFQQAHQTQNGRAKITLIPLAVVAIAIFGALAAHGYFDFHKTGLEPLKFAGNYLIDGNNPLYFGIPFATALIGSLGYIAKAPKSKEQQNFPHPAPVETNSEPQSPSNSSTSTPQAPTLNSPTPPNSDSPATSAHSNHHSEQQTLNQTPHYLPSFPNVPPSTASLYPGFIPAPIIKRTNVSAASSSSSSSVAKTPDITGLVQELSKQYCCVVPCYNYLPHHQVSGLTLEKREQRRQRFNDCENAYNLKFGQIRDMEFSHEGFHYFLVKWFNANSKLESYVAIGCLKKHQEKLMNQLSGLEITHNTSRITPPLSVTSRITDSTNSQSPLPPASSTTSTPFLPTSKKSPTLAPILEETESQNSNSSSTSRTSSATSSSVSSTPTPTT